MVDASPMPTNDRTAHSAGSSGRPRGPLVWIGAVALIALGAVVWHKQIRFRLFPKNFGVVEAGALYRGADQHPGVLEAIIRKHRIRTVIDLTGRDPIEDAICEAHGIDRYGFSMPGDGRGPAQRWAGVLHLLMDESKHPIFIHCHAGAQRTTTAVLLYQRMRHAREIQETYPDSFDYRHRPDEWEILAYLADHRTRIEAILDSGTTVHKGREISIAQYAESHRRTRR